MFGRENMRISDKRAAAVYSAIADPITELRVSSYSGQHTLEEMDEKLFKLQQEIWWRLIEELNLETKP